MHTKDKQTKSKEKKKRCFYCKKRLKLLDINLCKCEKIFCPKHRYFVLPIMYYVITYSLYE